MATEAAVLESPSTLNEPSKEVPAEETPEGKLFPEPKAPEVKPEVKPTELTPGVAPEEPKKEEPEAEPSKPSTEPKAVTVDYENLKLPDGSLLSADELAEVKKVAKDSGLTLDEAQGVLEVKNDAVKAYSARQTELIVKARQEWKESWSNDPEYGGDKLKENTELAKRAWGKLADNELKTLADQTGFGDHPAVLRMMARIGRLFSEDTLIRGSVGGAPKQRSPEEVLYGKTTPGTEEPMS